MIKLMKTRDTRGKENTGIFRGRYLVTPGRNQLPSETVEPDWKTIELARPWPMSSARRIRRNYANKHAPKPAEICLLCNSPATLWPPWNERTWRVFWIKIIP